jgi:acetate kinase
MAITLVVNPGSTSRKYALYRDGALLASVQVERTPQGVESCVTEVNGIATCTPLPGDALEDALVRTLAYFTTQGIVANPESISQVAVRVVAPGERFAVHGRIDEAYIEALARVAYLVPVHIPIVLHEIRMLRTVLPEVSLIAVSDSAFHQTAYPETTLQSLGVPALRRFGYHGLSVASVAHRVQQFVDPAPSRIIVIHVGGGVSVTAVKDGRSVATSMGFTPASGMLMGGRGGDVEAGTLLAFMHEHSLAPSEALTHLYTEAGFKAVAGVSDLRMLLEHAAAHDAQAALALAAFLHQLRSWIVSHIVLMGGVDAVVLTATAVQRNPDLRAKIFDRLELFKLVLDAAKNEVLIGKEGRIEAKGSLPVVVMKTDEMREMAMEAVRYLEGI